MLIIEYPADCAPETDYVLAVIFDVFLGIPYDARPTDCDGFRLSVDDAAITLPSVFFPALAQGKTAALIEAASASWDSAETGWDLPLIDPILPVLFGTPSFEESDRHIHLGVDIFGAAFFMLSRYEEIGGDRHDARGRFPAKESLAYRQGFLLRPIIDEYVEVLFAAMQRLWPGLQRKARQFTITPTHDVDIPYLGVHLHSARLLLKRCAGDLLKRHSTVLAARTVRSYWRARLAVNKDSSRAGFAGDPYDVFDWFMSQSEQAGRQSRFYFMTDHELHHPYGGNYDIDALHIGALIRDIAVRGHEIGIHPTSESYHDRTALLGQSARFRRAVAANGVEQDAWGGRHHYLRWRAEMTPRFWHDAGLAYDSTLGYAEHVGFRCGTCHAFPLWGHGNRTRLDVFERPLIVMECSLLDSGYMGLETSQAAAIVQELQRAVRTVQGDFVFLWHNSALLTPSDRDLYRVCLDL